MKSVRFCEIILCALCLLASSAANAQQDYSKLVAFGDSLSDTGNLSSVTLPFPYPFYQNRVSDGPVALDYLAESIGSTASASLHLDGSNDGYNYAVAGGNILGSDVEDLAPQVSAYLNRVNGAADTQALHAVIMGGNDIRAIRGITSSSIANSEINLILDQLFTQLTRLSNAGATQFLIANVANIGRIPETLQREASDPGVSNRVEGYSQSYNVLLQQRVTDFVQQTGAQITLFDLFAELETIIDNATQLGFSYTEVGCFVDLDFHPGCLFGFAFDQFIFFDNLHPTNGTNQIIAQAMIERLEQVLPEIPVDNSSASFLPAIMLLLNN